MNINSERCLMAHLDTRHVVRVFVGTAIRNYLDIEFFWGVQ